MKDLSPSPSNGTMNEHENPARGLVQLESLLEKRRKNVDLTALREKLAAGRGPALFGNLLDGQEQLLFDV